MKKYIYNYSCYYREFNTQQEFAEFFANDFPNKSSLCYARFDSTFWKTEYEKTAYMVQKLDFINPLSDTDYKIFGMILREIPKYWGVASNRLGNSTINTITPFKYAARAVSIGAKQNITSKISLKRKELKKELLKSRRYIKNMYDKPVKNLNKILTASLELTRTGLFPEMESYVMQNYNAKLAKLSNNVLEYRNEYANILIEMEKLNVRKKELFDYINFEYKIACDLIKKYKSLYR